MGVNQSQPTSLGEQSDIYNKTGYHVLQVYQNSPSSGLLQCFFDFIVAANGVVFEKEDNRFADTFRLNIGKPVELVVYNIKSNSTRTVSIIPSQNWGGQGLAGISIRFCSWEKVLENVWHVLDVYMASPAYEANLQTRTDYIVGTPDIILNEQEDFFKLVNNNMYRPIQLYIYSSLTELIRLVTITPNKNWGGSGSLGCDIGYGLLHRIPTKKNLTSQMLGTNEQLKSPNIPLQQQQQPLLYQQQQLSPNSPYKSNNIQSNNTNTFVDTSQILSFEMTPESSTTTTTITSVTSNVSIIQNPPTQERPLTPPPLPKQQIQDNKHEHHDHEHHDHNGHEHHDHHDHNEHEHHNHHGHDHHDHNEHEHHDHHEHNEQNNQTNQFNNVPFN